MSRFVASLITDFFSRVLLVRHRSRAWELPGGHIEPRESLGAAARRECEEEAGVFPQLAARPRRVIGDCAVFFGVSEYDPEPGDPAIAEALWLTREEVRGLTLSDLPSAEVLREWAGLERAPAAVESAYYDILAAAVRAAHGLPRTATVGEMAAAVGRAQEGADNLDAAAVRAREAYLSVLECDWRRPMADNERATWRRVALAARGGMAPTAPLPEAHPAPPPGFAGSRGRVLGEAVDGAHVVRLVEYTFGDNSRVPYVELHETHDGARPGRVMALSALVHLAQNVGDSEVWAIGNREGPPPETTPLPEDVRAAAEEALRLAEKATPGPWQYSTEPHDERPDTNEVADLVNGDWVITHSELRPSDHDGRLIACARTLLPLLARAVLSGHTVDPTPPTGVMAETAATKAMAAEIASLRALVEAADTLAEAVCNLDDYSQDDPEGPELDASMTAYSDMRAAYRLTDARPEPTPATVERVTSEKARGMGASVEPMTEADSYGWARQALAPVEGADGHRYQQALDKVSSAVREAWAHRRAGQPTPEPERTQEAVLRAMLSAYDELNDRCSCLRDAIAAIVTRRDAIAILDTHGLRADYEARLSGARRLHAPPLDTETTGGAK